jgi:hypothetical protein
MLRALALTADGSKLATASTKGTVLRVWDVATSTCLQEFRRGVERANITCLCWSWDYQWLSCTSDKGTAHVFFVGSDEQRNKEGIKSDNKSSMKRLLSSVKKSVKGDTKKYSVCQIRGVPHPLACAFVVDAPNVLAVAGWDADGNGVLLLSEFAAHQEARRIAYHVLVKSSPQMMDAHDTANLPPETEEERRRRRLRGWKPTIPSTPIEGRIFCGERGDQDTATTGLEQGMEQIHFDDKGDFVTITTTTTHNNQNNNSSNRKEHDPIEESSSAVSAPSSSKPVIDDRAPDQQRDIANTTAGTADSDNIDIPKDTSKEGIKGSAPSLQDDSSVPTEQPLDEPEHQNGNGSTALQEQHLEAEATLQ